MPCRCQRCRQTDAQHNVVVASRCGWRNPYCLWQYRERSAGRARSGSGRGLSGNTDISLNPKILLRLLAGFDAENIRLSAGDRRSDPLRIDAGPDRFAVLCPMREFSDVLEEAA
jgi:hypothetical protein